MNLRALPRAQVVQVHLHAPACVSENASLRKIHLQIATLHPVQPAQTRTPTREIGSAYGNRASSAFIYNYYRDYDPQIGRYTESDPIGLRAGLSTYGYVKQKPTSKTDPYGLRQPEPEPDPPYPPFFPGPINPIPPDLRVVCWAVCRIEAQPFCSASAFVGIQVGRGLCAAGGSVAGPAGSAGGAMVGGYLGGGAAFLACNMIVQPMCEQRCGYRAAN